MHIPYRIFQVSVICFFLLAALTGCQSSPNPGEVTFDQEPSPTIKPTVSPESLSNNFPVRLRLITNSDWTTFKIITGADLVNPNLVSKSSEATTADIQGNRLSLNQDPARAELDTSVEMVVEAQLNLWENHRNVLLMIERGEIGATRVDISRQVDDDWVVIKSFLWDGNKGDGLNSFSVKVASEEFLRIEPVEVVEIPTLSPTPKFTQTP